MSNLKLFIPCLALALAACNDDTAPGTDAADTALEVHTSIAGSRAMITDKSFAEGQSMGITLVDNTADAVSYDGKTQGYANVCYTAKGSGDAQYWQSTAPVMLSSTEGKAVAYYPYSQTAADYKAIPVKADGQTDYMYSGWVAPISNSNSSANFTMKHALSAVRIMLTKGTYTGDGVWKDMRMTSYAFGTEGTLNAATGSITGVTVAEVNSYMMNPAWDKTTVLSAEHPTSMLIMVVPKDNVNDDVVMNFTIDEKTYRVKGLMTTPFMPGNIYTFRLTLDNSALVLDGQVTIEEWIEDTSASADNDGKLTPAED